MYRVQHYDRSCRILDDDDRIVFAGSFRECEDWLDQAENRRRMGTSDSPADKNRPGWFRWLWNLFSRQPSQSGQCLPTRPAKPEPETEITAADVPEPHVSERLDETEAPLR